MEALAPEECEIAWCAGRMVNSNVWVKLKLAKLGLKVWIWSARTHGRVPVHLDLTLKM